MLILEVFKRLKGQRQATLSVSNLWQYEWVKERREWLQGYERSDLEQAFHNLDLSGFAKLVSSDYYRITELGMKTSPVDVMYRFVKTQHTETKNTLRAHRFRLRVGLGFYLLAIAFAVAFVLLFLLGSSPIYWQVTAILVFVLTPIAVYFLVASTTYWKEHHLSKEKSLVVYLLDAYEYLTKGDRVRAQKLVKKVGRALESPRKTTDWSTLDRESENMSGIGRDIRTILLPALADEKRSREDVGEILVRLACLFFEGSSESISRAPRVYQHLGPPKPSTPPVTPISKARPILVRSTILRLPIAAVGALALSVIVFSVVGYLQGRPLLDYLQWIGSAFIVSFMAFIGIFVRSGGP